MLGDGDVLIGPMGVLIEREEWFVVIGISGATIKSLTTADMPEQSNLVRLTGQKRLTEHLSLFARQAERMTRTVRSLAPAE